MAMPNLLMTTHTIARTSILFSESLVLSTRRRIGGAPLCNVFFDCVAFLLPTRQKKVIVNITANIAVKVICERNFMALTKKMSGSDIFRTNPPTKEKF